MDKLGKLLASARANKIRSKQITWDQVSHLTPQDGYTLLKHTTESLQRDYGWKIVGWKVGATSAAVQQKIGLKEPFWGPIYERTVQTNKESATRFSISQDMIRGIEAEFAFQIKRDIVPRKEAYSARELMTEYCSTVSPCVEVCASRVQPDIMGSTALLIGDTGNFSVVFPLPSKYEVECVKVAVQSDEIKLAKSVVKLDGVQIASGSGADVLGSPVLSLEWFVNHVVNGQTQLTISQGEFVTTGASCGLIPITKPCYANIVFSGLSETPCEVNLAFRE